MDRLSETTFRIKEIYGEDVQEVHYNRLRLVKGWEDAHTAIKRKQYVQGRLAQCVNPPETKDTDTSPQHTKHNMRLRSHDKVENPSTDSEFEEVVEEAWKESGPAQGSRASRSKDNRPHDTSQFAQHAQGGNLSTGSKVALTTDAVHGSNERNSSSNSSQLTVGREVIADRETSPSESLASIASDTQGDDSLSMVTPEGDPPPSPVGDLPQFNLTESVRSLAQWLESADPSHHPEERSEALPPAAASSTGSSSGRSVKPAEPVEPSAPVAAPPESAQNNDDVKLMRAWEGADRALADLSDDSDSMHDGDRTLSYEQWLKARQSSRERNLSRGPGEPDVTSDESQSTHSEVPVGNGNTSDCPACLAPESVVHNDSVQETRTLRPRLTQPRYKF